MKTNFLKWGGLFTNAAILFFAGLRVEAQTDMKNDQPKRVLVVSVTAGFRHSAIPLGNRVLGELAQKSGAFTVDYVLQPSGAPPPEPRKPANLKPDADEAAKKEFAAKMVKYEEDLAAFKSASGAWSGDLKSALKKMSPENLKNYDAVVFNSTTGDLPLPDKAGFLKWIEDGHAFIGIHAATDTFRGHTPLDPYVLMLGGEFKEHPPGLYEVECINQDPQHPATRHLGATWKVKDEIYQMNGFDRATVHGLLMLDKHAKTKAAGYFPIAWCKKYGKGNVFYTALGHADEVWNSPEFQQHLLGGIKWALGLEPGDAAPQAAQK